jgi:hypothetical protein
MKNKKLIYILLFLVVSIWITIIIKVVSFSKDPQGIIDNKIVKLNDDQLKQKLDTFLIVANYPDPFLKSKNKSESNKGIADIKDKKISNQNKKISNIKWPQLVYCGLVNNNSNNQKIGFLKINDKDFLVKQGDIIEEIFLEYIYNDSIQLSYMDESRVIKKK